MRFNWFSVSRSPKIFEFRCAGCGEIHKGSPSFGYQKPPIYFAIPEEEREARIRVNDDFCQIDDDMFFIRALLEIPIHGVEDPFMWGVWVSQSQESFERYVETFEQDQSGDGSFGWLQVTMPGYVDETDAPEACSLACDVIWRGGNDRPLVEVQCCDHPLHHDQATGISWDRAIELAQKTMHD